MVHCYNEWPLSFSSLCSPLCPSMQALRPQLPKRGVLLFSHLPFIPVLGIPRTQELLPPSGSSVQVPDWLEEARFHHQFCRLRRHTQVRMEQKKKDKGRQQSGSLIVVVSPPVDLSCTQLHTHFKLYGINVPPLLKGAVGGPMSSQH